MSDLAILVDEANTLADMLAADVELASTREEHIRVSARAQAARNLVSALEDLTR
jgi:hypothetical protein